MNKIDNDLLASIANLHSVPQGAYNIRKNGQLLSRRSSASIEIITKQYKPGIDIRVANNTKNESIHIPVIITQENITDLVYNDFYIGENCDIVIVAGCGIHNNGNDNSEHNGVHTFYVGKNSKITYIEKHLGTGNKNSGKILNPQTIINMDENSTMTMQTIQLGGVTSSNRQTFANLSNSAKLEIQEKIFTENNQTAQTLFNVNLYGDDSKVNVISRSVAKGDSQQLFHSQINGNAKCFGHIECDAIIMDNAKVKSIPEISANNIDASLTHEAAIGKIAGEQIIKLMTLGLTANEAEEMIIKGFLE